MCVNVVYVYEDDLKKGECYCGEEWDVLRRLSRREESIRWNGVCKSKMCVGVKCV